MQPPVRFPPAILMRTATRKSTEQANPRLRPTDSVVRGALLHTGWPDGGVVTQRTANPCTPVRFRLGPPSLLFGKSIIRSRAQRPAIAEIPPLPSGKLITMVPANGLPCSFAASDRALCRAYCPGRRHHVRIDGYKGRRAKRRKSCEICKSIDPGAASILVPTTPAQSRIETRSASFAQTAITHDTFHPDNVI